MFRALVNFGQNVESDVFASAIVIDAYVPALGAPFFMNAYEYTRPIERPASFDDFLNIQGNTSDTMRITNIASLTDELEQPNADR